MAKIRPVPELVHGVRWTVDDSPDAATSPALRVFRAPFADTPNARAVRAHELAHVKHSPKNPARELAKYGEKTGGQPLTLAVVEDARVNLLVQRRGVDLSALFTDDECARARQLAKKPTDDPEHLIKLVRVYFLFRSVSRRNPELGAALDCVRSALGEHLRTVEALYARFASRLTYKNAWDVALLLDRLFGHGAPDIIEEAIHDLGRYKPPADVNWAPMDVFLPSLSRPNSRKARVASSRKMTDVGTFCAPHRIPPIGDGSAFRTRTRKSGGGLLIDNSGSMGIPPADILRVLEVSPFAVVAAYSSRSVRGTLAVLARNGLMTDFKTIRSLNERFGVCNCVDGPALHWLVRNAKQPLVWVTDGRVTGAGDVFNTRLALECAEIVRRHNVRVVRTIHEAIEYLRKAQT